MSFTIKGDELFGVLSHIFVFSLYVYCTACFSCLKVGPGLQINQSFKGY